jgi:hypothetical protein
LPGDRIEQAVRASHATRERYWLDEILSLDVWPLLFVCGANHVHPFRTSLQAEGIDFDVAADDWSPD